MKRNINGLVTELGLLLVVVLFLSFGLPGCTPVDDSTGDALPSGKAQQANAVAETREPIQPIENHFIGSEACGTCHASQFASFAKTDHHRSFSRPDIENEVELDSFVHSPSGQFYSVEFDGERLLHKGWQGFGKADGKLPISAAEIKYVVGSGAFGKGYLREWEGSLFQVPLTFYVRPEKYGMSPGYDTPNHVGFTREVSGECLFCHVGWIERTSEPSRHLEIRELAIGCERCHGKGGNHASSMQDSNTLTDEIHSQIVNPKKLKRDQLESLCAQCHLQGDVTIYPEGKNAWAFEPGQLLEQSRIVYAASTPEGAPRFVGHFPQMHASECYKQSTSLTCVTCHDPHHAIDEAEKITSHRNNCLKCHDNEDCGEDLDKRLTKNQNSCFECHMVRGVSEVPHASVTNHRIAIYSGKSHQPQEKKQGKPALAALVDGSPMNSWQRNRNELSALAQWLVEKRRFDGIPDHEVRSLISQLDQSLSNHQASSKDQEFPVVNESQTRVMLARLISPYARWRYRDASDSANTPATSAERAQFMSLLRTALQNAALDTPEYRLALSLHASAMSDRKNYNQAIRDYEQLVKLRHDSADWYNLGLSYARQRRFQDSEAALRRSILIEPNYSSPYRSLGKLYKPIDPSSSAKMLGLADLLDSPRD